jgi:hypothetical protein
LVVLLAAGRYDLTRHPLWQTYADAGWQVQAPALIVNKTPLQLMIATPPMPPHLDYEWQLIHHGHHVIAGVDEVGRGCWAAPVVAAAVVLSDAVLHMPAFLQGLNDSKQLSATQRNQLVQVIQRGAVGIGIGWVAATISIASASSMPPNWPCNKR